MIRKNLAATALAFAAVATVGSAAHAAGYESVAKPAQAKSVKASPSPYASPSKAARSASPAPSPAASPVGYAPEVPVERAPAAPVVKAPCPEGTSRDSQGNCVAPTSNAALPRTGGEMLVGGLLGMSLLAGGSVLVIVSRRRRNVQNWA